MSSGKYVLGRKAFEAISAVEGLKLSSAGKKRVSSASSGKISTHKVRLETVRAYKT